MKAVLTDERFSDPDWIYERKLDGIRCVAIKAERAGARCSRATTSASTAASRRSCDALEQDPATNFVLDGEVAAVLPSGVTSFQALQNRRAPIRRWRISSSTCCTSTDATWRAQPIEDRKQRLRDLLDDKRHRGRALSATPIT